MAFLTFSYNISRPYPFRWFTPVVIVGGLIALVLFSLINFVSTGYYLSTGYVTDPNSTVTIGKWLDHWPSYFTSQRKPTCQANDIQVNSKFFTNQTALTYTLASVWTLSNGDVPIISPALTYLNNPIQNCQVNNVQILIEAEDRTPAQYGRNGWGEYLQAFITCSIQSQNETIFFNLTTDYDYVPPTVSASTGLFKFITRNETTKASLWWGESLMSQYWSYVSSEMQHFQTATTNTIRKGTIDFSLPNPDNPLQDITDLRFWNIDYRFLSNPDTDGDSSGVTIYFPKNPTSVDELAVNETSPNIWIAADSLAKSFYSTIMTDLGQTSTPNILLDEMTLEYFTQNFTAMQKVELNAIPGPARDSYENSKNETGPLGVSAAVMSTKYLCQIPIRKSKGTLLVSILVADLVFMQALWKILTLLAGYWLSRKDPNANHCEGCTNLPEKRDSSMSLVEISPQKRPLMGEMEIEGR